jgi:hypothetical protein
LFDMLVKPYGTEHTAHGRRGGARHPVAAVDVAVAHLARAECLLDTAVPLGDCWRHSAVRGPGLTDGWMPFHKLSQWLTYSLIEPFEWGGVQVRGLDALTGLPEYRNGGLLLDSGVIRLKDPAQPPAPTRPATSWWWNGGR